MKWNLVFLGCMTFNWGWSQQSLFEEEPKIVPFLKGSDFLFSATYGYPNWGKFNMESYFENQNSQNTSAGGIAPLTLTASYFYDNQISFSLIGMYNNWGGSWQSFLINDTYSFNVQRFRVLFGIEYHFFDFDIDKVDLYAGAAIGGNSVRVTYETSDSTWSPRMNNYFMQNNDNLNFPLTARFNAGMRYFFTDHLGANIELSYGGASLSFGMSYKF